MNHNSSRSHCIFRLFIKSLSNEKIREYLRVGDYSSNINNANLLKMFKIDVKNINHFYYLGFEDHYKNTYQLLMTDALLNFIDLAGSEKVSNHYSLSIPSSTVNPNSSTLHNQSFNSIDIYNQNQP